MLVSVLVLALDTLTLVLVLGTVTAESLNLGGPVKTSGLLENPKPSFGARKKLVSRLPFLLAS
jgi:hypothetical protein